MEKHTLQTQTLHQAFFAQAEKTPDLSCLIDDKLSLSYQETKALIIYFQHKLYQKGIQKGFIVSLYCEKRFEIVIAFLAISSLGAKCVQLDKAFPRALLKDILLETETDLLLCDEPFKAYDNYPLSTMSIQLDKEILSNTTQQKPIHTEVLADDPLWLVYSSGTTGKHKGISIPHKAILSSYKARNKIKNYDQNSKVGCNIYYLWEVFRPILSGGTSYIIPDDILHDFNALAHYLTAHNINECLFTPSYLETLLHVAPSEAEMIFQQLNYCWLNGEVVSSALYHKLMAYLDHTHIYNLYSISECHDVAVYALNKEDAYINKEQVVPVGFVLDGVEVVLLNEQKMLCKPGEKGELYVHSNGLADGYINREALNKERFIEKAQSPINKRLYKTGDHALLSHDNTLITVYGRCDYLVKLRGYTVSLPFVEAVIKDKLDITHCVVTKSKGELLDEHLIAYLEVADEEKEAFYQDWELNQQTHYSQKITDTLGQFLAPYMRPQSFIVVDKIKLNAYSNKLDRLSIQAAQLQISSTQQHTEVTNIDSIEDYKNLWAELLKLPVNSINKNDCFFKLGGSSLTAMMLIIKAYQLGLNKLKISQFAANSTLAKSFELMQKKTQILHDNKKHLFDIQSDVELYLNQLSNYALESSYLDPTQANLSQEKHWLLTGATGFLGAEILYQLLSTTHDRITCIIRSKNTKEAYIRLEKVLERFDLNLKDFETRIDVIKGDLADEHMTLDNNTWERLSHSITDIIHAASLVNLILPYDKIKASALTSTANMIKLALNKKRKHFYHVSTNGIFSGNKSSYQENNDIDDYLSIHQSGYAQAKWAAEKLIFLAQKNHTLNATIFRPGNLSAAREKHINPSDANTLLINAMLQLKSIPNGLQLEMSPVDHIAKMILLSTQQKQQDTIYNLTNKVMLNTNDLSSSFNLPVVDKDKWISMLSDPALKCLIDSDPSILSTASSYEQANYEALMRLCEIKHPEKQQLLTQFTLQSIRKNVCQQST